MRPSQLLRPSAGRTFESLYRRHVDDVYRYSLALLDRPPDAEDATQATFLNAYRALERGERPRNSRRWLRAIALNVCREHWRRASSRPDEVSLEEDPGELVADEPTPAVGELLRAMSKLPFNQRAALVMREFEGRSLSEIAAALDVTGAAVESLLFRGRRALREQLEGSIRCHQAEKLISRQLDGRVGYTERGRLRAHLRECEDCAKLARRLRAQRKAVRSLALVPVPAGLSLRQLGLPGSAHGVAAASASGGTKGGLASLAGVAGASAPLKLGGAAILAAGVFGVGYAISADHGSHAKSASARARSGISSPSAGGSGASGLFGIGSSVAGAKLAGAGEPQGRGRGARHGSGSSSAARQQSARSGPSGIARPYGSGASLAAGSAPSSVSAPANGAGHSHPVAGGHRHHASGGGGNSHSHGGGGHPVHPVTPQSHIPPGHGGGRGHAR